MEFESHLKFYNSVDFPVFTSSQTKHPLLQVHHLTFKIRSFQMRFDKNKTFDIWAQQMFLPSACICQDGGPSSSQSWCIYKGTSLLLFRPHGCRHTAMWGMWITPLRGQLHYSGNSSGRQLQVFIASKKKGRGVCRREGVRPTGEYFPCTWWAEMDCKRLGEKAARWAHGGGCFSAVHV